MHQIAVTSLINFTGDSPQTGSKFVCGGRTSCGELETAIYAVDTGSMVLKSNLRMQNHRDHEQISLSWYPSVDMIAIGLVRSVLIWHISTNRTTVVLSIE